MSHAIASRFRVPAFPGGPTFGVVWLGQLVSVLGSNLSAFALGLWLYDQTGSATPFALVALATALPRLLLSPLAGVAADRYDRRLVMLGSDALAALSTLGVALLFVGGRLEPWHVYLAATVSAVGGTFQYPAYSAALTTLVSEKSLGRANGLVQLCQAVAEIFAPALAGLLVVGVGIGGILLVDFATFLFAATTLGFVRFPRSAPAAPTERAPLRANLAVGLRYIAERPGLRGLLLFFAVVNFLWGMVAVLVRPLVLDFATPTELGLALTVAGGGVLLGTLALSAWGGPGRRVRAILGFEALSGLAFVLLGLRPEIALVAVGAFVAHLTLPIVNGSAQALLQSRVPADLQGRVFATWQMVSRSATPLAYLAAGLLADGLFAPLLVAGGPLAASLGPIFGVGPGRGIGLLFAAMGALKLLAATVGWLSRDARDAGCQRIR